jgi:phosphoglycerol transferase MdoB-like AlkP superfamily enzyme
MYFDQFAKLAGFQQYFGFDQFPDAKQDDDGAWGVYDEPFLQFMLRTVSGFRGPFFASFYSLTSHQPYPVPAAFRGRFPKGSLEILESIGYADYALARFFAEAEKQDWYRDTLFVITADHTEKPYLEEYNHEIGRYRVPLIFFHPGLAWPAVDTLQTTQHADIAASILDVLGVDAGESLGFGRSVFRSGERYAVLYNTLDYYLLDREWSLRFHKPDEWFVHDSVKDPAFKSPLRKWPKRARLLRRRLEATLQYFQNGLIENNLLIPDPQPGSEAADVSPRR